MSVRNLPASVRLRLLNRARAEGRPFNELLQHYAMERFLYRLSRSRFAGRFVLKGALLLRVWEAPVGRPTLDIDLLGRMDNEVDAVAEAIYGCAPVGTPAARPSRSSSVNREMSSIRCA